jgi:uncharacterized protein YecE (DUF72 family)
MGGRIRLGIAGWVFDEWRGEFYPKGLPQKQELGYASGQLGSIEINSTFYSNQKAASFESWAGQTPDDFMFSVKGHQLVTHLKKLKDVEIPLANFFASGVLALGKRLGPFCWQLPGNLKYDEAKIETFLGLLPQDPDALLKLAKKNEGLKNEPHLDISGVSTIRHAMEVRHESFAEPKFIDQLRRYNVALVTADTADWPYQDLTADFAYCRLQGAPGQEKYEAAEVDAWAEKLDTWSKGRETNGPLVGAPGKGEDRDVFAYFVSTDKVHAPRNARQVMTKLAMVTGV